MEIPLSPLCRGSGAPKTTKDQGARHGGRLGSQLCRWGLLNTGIVSRLKNGLNWPAMEKSTAGSNAAACSDLGEVSQEISNSAGFLS